MKGAGGVIGLTENPAALSHWMIVALKLRNLLVNLKVSLMCCTDLCIEIVNYSLTVVAMCKVTFIFSLIGYSSHVEIADFL